MKKIAIILLGIISLAFDSCKKEQDDYFDKPASERMAEALANAKNVLEGAENGWAVKYFPNPQQIFGRYNLFFKFSEGNITVCSEVEGSKTTETSLYSMGEDLGPTITFDTKNSLINYFTHPKNPDGLGSTYKGMEGDYEFTVMSAKPEQTILRGIKSGNMYVLAPITTSDWQTEMQVYLDNAEDMEFTGYYCLVKGEKLAVTRSYRTFTITTADGKNIQAPYIYTKTGISFYEPVTINGITAKDLNFVDDYYFEDAAGADFKIMTPEPVRSDIAFQLSVPEDEYTYKGAKVKVTPTKTDEYYYIGVMTKADFRSLREKKIISQLVSSVNDYITSAEDAVAIAEKMLYKGATNEDFNYLSYYEDYVVVTFGCAVVDNSIVATTGITSVEFKIDPSLLPSNATDAYKAWLGVWEVTSASSEKTGQAYTFTITIKPNVINSSYKVTGWGYTYLKDTYDVNATYLSSTKALRFAGDQKLLTWPDGKVLTFRCRYQDVNNLSSFGILGTTNAANIAGVPTGEGTAEATGRMGSLTSGVKFQISSMDLWNCLPSNNYYLAAASGYTYQDFFIGPYTMVRKVDVDGRERVPANLSRAVTAHQISEDHSIRLMQPASAEKWLPYDVIKSDSMSCSCTYEK